MDIIKAVYKIVKPHRHLIVSTYFSKSKYKVMVSIKALTGSMHHSMTPAFRFIHDTVI